MASEEFPVTQLHKTKCVTPQFNNSELCEAPQEFMAGLTFQKVYPESTILKLHKIEALSGRYAPFVFCTGDIVENAALSSTIQA